MASRHKQKAGTRGNYPRVRAKNVIAKFSNFKAPKELKVLNFYGYKAGMVHVMATNKHKGSALHNQRLAIPATVVEFPSLTVFGVRFYHKPDLAMQVLKEFLFYDKASKRLAFRIKGSDKAKSKGDALKLLTDFYNQNKSIIADVRLVTHTNPDKTTIGQKVPDVLELLLSGTNDQKFEYFTKKLGNGIEVDEVFKDGSFLDARAVTRGFGFEGVIKRFGVRRRSHKAEKGTRKVGSISAWHPPLVMWTAPRPGQMGFHNRTQFSVKMLKALDADKLNHPAGFEGYGVIRNKSVLIAGSIPGHVKRLVTFRDATRTYRDIKHDISEIDSIVF